MTKRQSNWPELFGMANQGISPKIPDDLFCGHFVSGSGLGASSGSYDYAIMMTSHCEVLADEILVDCSQNSQSAKINSPPKFLAIRYV